VTSGWRLRVCSVITVVLFAVVGPACAQPIDTTSISVIGSANRIAGFVMEASRRFALPPSWIRAVMRVESGGDVRALSPKCAVGLMQIVPETWATLRLRYGLGTDPYDPHDNITAGAAYLRELHDRYGDLGFLAAYNAGPGRYEDHLATGRPLPSETRSYVSVVAALIHGDSFEDAGVTAAMGTPWFNGALFAQHSATGNAQLEQRPTDGSGYDGTALTPHSDGLFVRTSSHRGGP
jgi:Transglycosylase SLT domain